MLDNSKSKLESIFLLIKHYLDKIISFFVIVFVASFVIAVLTGILTRQIIKPLIVLCMNDLESGSLLFNILNSVKLFLNQLGAATGDFSKMMLIWVTMSASSLMFSSRGHLGVDYFVGKMNLKARQLVSILVYMLILFFIISIFFVGGIKISISSWSQQMQNIPISKGIIYMILPIGGFFTLFYLIFQILSDIFSWETNQFKNRECK